MEPVFRTAEPSDIDGVFSLIKERVKWMDEVGIRQWNDTDYLGVYPKNYYLERIKSGELFLCEQEGLAGLFVLFDRDERWRDDDTVRDACYLHHLATDPDRKGLGRLLVAEAERIARSQGKRRLRLDCAIDNAFLNRYYELMGYQLCGECVDGAYIGNLREKVLL